MKQNFDIVIPDVLASEGGYVNHPKDPGGATNLGVTIGTAKRLGIDIDGDGDTDIIDIKLLKPNDAAKVFKAEYWNKVRGNELPSGLDYAVFDFAINSGPKRAIIGLQRLLGVADDGVIGPITLKKVSEISDLKTFINRYQDDRLRFLKQLSTFKTFGKGWTARVEKVRKTALELVAVGEVVTPGKSSGGFNWSALIPIIITILTAIFGATRK